MHAQAAPCKPGPRPAFEAQGRIDLDGLDNLEKENR